MTLEYAFDSRPTPAIGGYRTAIDGLYLCGAGTHPGGAVTGAPGRNAAHAVLEDRSGSRADPAGFTHRSHRAFADRVMDSATGGMLGRAALRSAFLRPLTRHFIRNRPK